MLFLSHQTQLMANNYDRVFKENIESLLLPLLRKILGLVPPKLVPVDAKLQVTQEAEMDHIRRVVHEDSSQDYGLQIEFHVTDEDLRKRNLLHYALFHNITDLPLRQIVIYGGMGVPNKIHQNALELSRSYTSHRGPSGQVHRLIANSALSLIFNQPRQHILQHLV